MTFEDIYRGNLWNGDESRSGPGSGTIATARIAEDLVSLVAELHVSSVLDIGCGDGWWMPDLPGYVGVDASKTAISASRLRHAHRTYVHAAEGWSVRDYAAPLARRFDLVIVRDVIQHLSLRDGLRLLDDILAIRPQWLLASTYEGGENTDIPTGVEAYAPDLTAAPFHLGRPVRMIFDGYTYHDPDAIRDPSKFLGLWRLRT